jgi:hypothetical protein
MCGAPGPAGLAGRHADVGEHNVRFQLVESGRQLVGGRTLGDDIEIGLEGQQADDALPHQ